MSSHACLVVAVLSSVIRSLRIQRTYRATAFLSEIAALASTTRPGVKLLILLSECNVLGSVRVSSWFFPMDARDGLRYVRECYLRLLLEC